MIEHIDHNFNLHARRIPDSTKGMRVINTAHLTYVDSNLDCDTFNIIHITSVGKNLADELPTYSGH